MKCGYGASSEAHQLQGGGDLVLQRRVLRAAGQPQLRTDLQSSYCMLDHISCNVVIDVRICAHISKCATPH